MAVYIPVHAAQSFPTISVHPADAIVREGSTHVLHCATATTSEL